MHVSTNVTSSLSQLMGRVCMSTTFASFTRYKIPHQLSVALAQTVLP